MPCRVRRHASACTRKSASPSTASDVARPLADSPSSQGLQIQHQRAQEGGSSADRWLLFPGFGTRILLITGPIIRPMHADAGSASIAPNEDAMSAVGSSPERAAVRGSPTARLAASCAPHDLIAKGGKARTFESPRFPRSSRFNPVPVMPTNVDPRTIFSQEDMGERASFPFSIYNTVAGSNRMRASSYRYAPAFKSQVDRFGQDRGSFMHQVSYPGFLEYEETRHSPTILQALSRPSTSIIGGNERRYATAFKSKIEFPKNIELPVNGGGIHARLDCKIKEDQFGRVPVYERSVAAEAEKHHGFPSAWRQPLIDNTIYKESSTDYRSSQYNRAQPHTLEARAVSSPMRYTCMTKKAAGYGSDRTTRRKMATDDIRDWYDLAHSLIPDLSVGVERSPIKYSGFNATRKNPDNLGKETRTSGPTPEIRPVSTDPTAPRTMATVWPSPQKSPARPVDGHPTSMVPARVCNNDVREARHRTIQEYVAISPVRLSGMTSKTDRTSEIDLALNSRPGSKLYVTRSQTEFYEGASMGLQDSQKPVGDRVKSTPQLYASAMLSQTVRSAIPPSIDPRQTPEHERRRQLILASMVETLRNKRPRVSPKMARILNLEPKEPAIIESRLPSEDRLELLQQSQDLHTWIGAPETPSRIRSVDTKKLADMQKGRLSEAAAARGVQLGSLEKTKVGQEHK